MTEVAQAPAKGAPGEPGSGGSSPHRAVLKVLPGLIVAMLLAQLDMTIVGTAMPRIVGDLGGVEHLAWVVTAYALASTVSTPLFGKLSDMYGRKRLFLLAIVIFLSGSALSGMAQTMTELIGFRTVQGLGAGGLFVGAMAIIGELVPPRERGRLQGYFAGVMALSMIGGPLLGGVLTDHLSWRRAFYINLPLGALALFLVTTTLHLPARRSPHRLDYPGISLISAGSIALVLLATWGGSEYAWGSPMIIGLGFAAAAAIVGFVVVERRVVEPVIPLRLFGDRNFSVASAVAFLAGLSMFGAVTFLPLFMQTAQGASATNSGALLIPMMVGVMVSSLLAGQIATRTGHYRSFAVVGGGVMAIGMLLLSSLDAASTHTRTATYMVVGGLGLGLLMQVRMLLSQNGVDARDMGVASSTAMFFQTIGGSLGVALFGAVFNHRLADAAGGTVGAAGGTIDPATFGQLPAAVQHLLTHAITEANQGVFWLAAAAAALAFLVGWAVKAVPLRGYADQPAEAAVPAADAAAAGELVGERQQGSLPATDRMPRGPVGTG